MVCIFMLVSVLLDHTRLANARDLRCAQSIRLEKLLCVDKFATRERSGIRYRERSEIASNFEK